MEFTFLTTTADSATPGRFASKEMRAHVTRGNFARRRQRIAQKSQEHRKVQEELSKVEQSQEQQVSQSHGPSPPHLALLVDPTDPERSLRYFLTNYHPVLFPPITGNPPAVSEITWVDLLRSEPALLEATLSLSSRHQNKDSLAKEPDLHAHRAVSMISKRLGNGPAAVSDGVLGAVFTLAFSERVSDNKAARGIHLKGLGQMLKVRRSQKQHSVPLWLSDLLLYDAITQRVTTGTALDDNVNYTLVDSDRQILADIGHVTDDLSHLRDVLELSYRYKMEPRFLVQEIEEPIARISARADAIRGSRPYLNALSISIIIFLHLSWAQSPLSSADLGHMAQELMDSFGKRDIRLCTSLYLTAWQLMVGGVSASDFEVRRWFSTTMKKHSILLHANTWEDALVMLKNSFLPHKRLLNRFKSFWEEMDAMNDVEVLQRPDEM